MEQVSADIDGYEISRCYEDGTRYWRVYARRAGSNWWTKLGYCGHAQESQESLDTAAGSEARKCIELGMVR